MNKRQKERAEREKLKKIIENNPKLLKFLSSSVELDNSKNKNLKELIEPVILDNFERIRMQGIQIGWYAHAARCVTKIKECKTVEEAIEILSKDVKAAKEKLGIKEDEDG